MNTGRTRSPRSPVHPHERGERILKSVRCPSRTGSSPRAWGTGTKKTRTNKINRFIPTSVGNGPHPGDARTPPPVHPHERGERVRSPVTSPLFVGSSPRAWGTEHEPEHRAPQLRFIPTSVGNGKLCLGWLLRETVHPHERGERGFMQWLTMALTGSSPRAWGTDPHDIRDQEGPRFIPTSVGNGARRVVRSNPRTVHPHERGERLTIHDITDRELGSSPRAWGTEAATQGATVRSRFIPTSVGNGNPGRSRCP